MQLFNVIKYIVAFQVISELVFSQENIKQENPEIIFVRIGKEWERLFTFPKNQSIFYSPNFGDDLVLKCVASYPIVWNLTGYLSPTEVVHIRPPKRHIARGAFEILVFIFFKNGQNAIDLAASVSIACQSVQNVSLKTEVLVVVRGNVPSSLFLPSTNSIEKPNLIPCPTLNLSTPVTLYRKTSNGITEPVSDHFLTFNPLEGFWSDRSFKGSYVCQQGSSSLTYTFSNTSSNILDDMEFSPELNIIRVFTEDNIKISCSSRSRRILNFVILDYNPILMVSFFNTTYGAFVNITSEHSSKTGGSTVYRGKVACFVVNDNGSKTKLKEWSYEFIETPQLYLDNYSGEVHCLSHISPKILQTVKCRNTIDCNFMTRCLENETMCNLVSRKQFFSSENLHCVVPGFSGTQPCVTVPYSRFNSLAHCKVAGITKTWETFVTLSLKKYSNWMDAPNSELIRMDEVDPILHTNRSTKFYCMAVAYLFADSLSFEMEFDNGSIVLLENNLSTVNISNIEEENDRKIDQFNIVGTLSIQLPLSAVGIHCIAPWWNSTDGIRTARKFETRHMQSPVLVEGQSATPTEITFFVGKQNQRLNCHAAGEPMPEYIWFYERNVTTYIFPELLTSTGSNGESYLEFPIYDLNDGLKYKGTYTCQSNNSIGTVEKEFIVNITEEPETGRFVLIVVVVVVILLILLIVTTLLVVFLQKYKQAKQLVRNLTDEEIEEFFKGKPELLGIENKCKQNAELVEFFPYDMQYEISIDDLEFDNSAKSYIGSGFFSYVVRGKVKSTNVDVAIKIAKRTAEVTFFKSLLSEIKIMIYLGNHENIVKLVGVCTQDIRNRTIHVATEICDLGNLNDYLRNARTTFLNLINENQQIDIALLATRTPEQEIITTLDLISFSAQIARGMEFLAYKSIIHADLATRNVLLTLTKVVKISDFGLSKKLYDSNNYVKKSKTPLPWRWMALESLKTLTFSTNSDIWSYGVTLYEIFTLGDIPFPNEEWSNEFITRLEGGMRMGRPLFSTQEIYSKIVACWEKQPDMRPSFSLLRTYFENLLKNYIGQNSTSISSGIPHTKPHYVNVSSCPSFPQANKFIDRTDNTSNINMSIYSNISSQNSYITT